MPKTIEQLQEEANILAEAKAGMKQNRPGIKTISKKVAGFVGDAVGKRPAVSRSVSPQRTILSKEQAMLNAMFGQKHQLWGNGQPVRISNTLTTGNGLIKTGSGNDTRRLFLP